MHNGSHYRRGFWYGLGALITLLGTVSADPPRFAQERLSEKSPDTVTIEVAPVPELPKERKFDPARVEPKITIPTTPTAPAPAPVKVIQVATPAESATNPMSVKMSEVATPTESAPVPAPSTVIRVGADFEPAPVPTPPVNIPKVVPAVEPVVPSAPAKLYPSFIRSGVQQVQNVSQGRRPIETSPDIFDRNLDALPERPEFPTGATIVPTNYDPPLGYTGPSGVIPRTGSNADFEQMEDRWRLGTPEWDRYGKGQVPEDDVPFELGFLKDPFNQNVLKGDFPIIGQHIFFAVTATSLTLFEQRDLPVGTTGFESTARQNQEEFFGRSGQQLTNQLLFLSLDLFRGDASFKPNDWRLKITPTFNLNLLRVNELALVSPDVRKGKTRDRTWFTAQEYFAEVKIADLSPEYDFASIRVGSQPFTSDFRGFIFSDTNRGARLFGTLNANRDQFNLVYFDMTEKDTNSGLNTFSDRHQNVLIANYYRQDFLFPGYTASVSLHYNDDQPSRLFDDNKFPVRPDPVGVFQPHRVQAAYLGWAGDGHIDRYNISHAFYWAVGHDSYNPMANREQDISAQMAALEVSYDRDWARFRLSGFYSSGDGNINNRHATGFDSIMDNQNFAGEFSYWNRQAIGLFGVNLVQRNSLIPDLRSSKTQGQANFVNPGLMLVNAGFDVDVTPAFRVINNANFLWFDKTNVLESFVYQTDIDRKIGLDVSTGFEYRPLVSNNIILIGGVGGLFPSRGFADLYTKLRSNTPNLFQVFFELTLTY